MTSIVNKYKSPWDVSVARDSIWGNPFVIGSNGDTRQEVIAKYRHHFYNKVKNDLKFREATLNLKDKVLGCTCKPQDCHGDVITQYLNHYKPLEDKIKSMGKVDQYGSFGVSEEVKITALTVLETLFINNVVPTRIREAVQGDSIYFYLTEHCEKYLVVFDEQTVIVMFNDEETVEYILPEFIEKATFVLKSNVFLSYE